MRTAGAIRSQKMAGRTTSRAAKKVPISHDFLLRQRMYNKLKRIIPDTAKTTPSHVLKTKLENAQSNPDMVALMSQFKYDEILDVAKELVAKGLFGLAQPPHGGYIRARKAAREAASEPSSEANVPDEIRRSGFRRLDDFQSAVAEAESPSSTSGNSITSFDQLLENHLETSRATSAASAVFSNFKPADILETTRSTKSIDGFRQATAVSVGVRDRRRKPRVSLQDTNGYYLETYVEKVYSESKPRLKGFHCHPSVSYHKIGHELGFFPGLSKLLLEHRPRDLFRLVRELCIRGLFLVNYTRYPSYREAAEEARKLVPQYADLPLRVCAVASQILSPYPWEPLRLPYVLDIEPVASRATVPDCQRMKLLPASEGSNAPHNNESSNVMETERIQIPASDLKQTTELNAAGSQISHPDISGTSKQVLEQGEFSNSAALVKPEVTAWDRVGEPSKTLRISGFRRRVNKKSLFEEFARFSPIELEVPERLVALITFTDIEAATRALNAKRRFFFKSSALRCTFTNPIHTRVVASRQLVDDHMRDLPSLPGDTWDEDSSLGSTSLPSKSHLSDLVDTTSTEEESSKSNVESFDDRLENKEFQVSVSAPAMSDGLGADEGIMSTKNSVSDPPSSDLRWDTLLDARPQKRFKLRPR
ncbi:hypothetical protein M436DRAFT_84995 [Aureobasidium namibiae CBS 147.97]|uniref:RRM domain-containing protein n=1 Tax=Aureobasidium namibiae CBS 147.97 TaxID=1043004 RepID=A0A074WJC6_9PEZI|nr:uncharacterized protein M436DRAFT_84995 [Aureobasidium namibiae CBS 147.97]KEQ69947.1 hypothetical protein M436DRAFT_84995 [Aureobasidium namibiae CBS 147.97]